MEIIDRKFKFVATNPCKNNVYTEENAIVFCAKDLAVPSMLREYIDRCKKLGCEKEHLVSAGLLLTRVLKYQEEIESRIPDTETDCEIRRCIDGET
jgi:hypothetical protein